MAAAGAKVQGDLRKEKYYSTYTPVGKVYHNPQAKNVVQKFIPLVAKLNDEMIAGVSEFNLRELARTYSILLGLSNAKLNKIDQALSNIPLELDNSTSTAALEGAQFFRVLAAGFFAGSDCESMLNEDFLGGENNADPVPGDKIVQDSFSIIWQVQNAGLDGFHLKEMAFNGIKENSTCYMSFYLNSPRQLDNLLIEPNVPKLYLNVETGCCIRVWLNGKEIFTQGKISAKPVNSQIPLLLGKGNNHILLKVVNTDTDYVVKAFLSSSHTDFIEKLVGTVGRN